MRKLISIAIISLSWSMINHLSAQEFTQTIRGKIIDIDSKVPLIGANVIILNSDPFKGAVTNLDGYYEINDVKVGRVDVKISYLGYEDKLLPNIMLGSGKELILNIDMTESLTQMAAVEITAEQLNGQVNDDMALMSARSVSVEETKRYAGSFDDPARMVSAFAGVNSNPEGNNDIVVRGNSPNGILWRMEGIEITNPNHFSDPGSSGGAISALNSAMLANSDFYTGAFAPAYGNALSGIFDIKLREGNYSRNETKLGIGVLGTEVAVEGPFSEGSNATYLLNYRYSSLALLDQLKLVDFNGIPKYQDFSFHIKLPTKKAGIFSIFGLSGLSSIDQKEYDENDESILTGVNTVTSFTGNVGIKNVYLFSDRTFLETIAGVSGLGKLVIEDDINTQGQSRRDDDLNMALFTPRFSLALNHKINARHKLIVGLIHSTFLYDVKYDYYDKALSQLVTQMDANGNTSSIQSYVSWKFRINERLSLVSGVHFVHFNLSNSNSIEPRLAADYEIFSKQFISAGFGIHSRLEPITSYYNNQGPPGSELVANKNLTSSKARHFVLGYKNRVNPNFLAIVEVYYQELYDIPVENNINSSFSMINGFSWLPNKDLINKGTGTNMGTELTLEHYFTRNYYFLITTSLYESKYKALDGIERNSRFNGNYIGNFLLGREFILSRKENKMKLLNLSVKFSYAGGQYYTPIDLEKSIANGTEYLSPDAYSQKGEDIFQMNFALSYRVERKKTSQVIKLDILNATNNQTNLYPYYDSDYQEIKYSTQLAMIPNISYIIEF